MRGTACASGAQLLGTGRTHSCVVVKRPIEEAPDLGRTPALGHGGERIHTHCCFFSSGDAILRSYIHTPWTSWTVINFLLLKTRPEGIMDSGHSRSCDHACLRTLINGLRTTLDMYKLLHTWFVYTIDWLMCSGLARRAGTFKKYDIGS